MADFAVRLPSAFSASGTALGGITEKCGSTALALTNPYETGWSKRRSEIFRDHPFLAELVRIGEYRKVMCRVATALPIHHVINETWNDLVFGYGA